MKNRRGIAAFEDVFYILGYLMFAGLLFFIVYFAYGQIKTPMDTTLTHAIPSGETSFNMTKASTQTLGGIGMFNNLYPLLILGLLIMVMVSASFVQSHPVFFFISLLLLFVAVILGVVFSNVYQQITEDANFADTKNHFAITNVFMKYLPFIIAIVIIVAMIIMFGKSGGGLGI